jgi:hypothetical protein
MAVMQQAIQFRLRRRSEGRFRERENLRDYLSKTSYFGDPRWRRSMRTGSARSITAGASVTCTRLYARSRKLQADRCGDSLLSRGGAGVPQDAAKSSQHWAIRLPGVQLANLFCRLTSPPRAVRRGSVGVRVMVCEEGISLLRRPLASPSCRSPLKRFRCAPLCARTER